MGACPSPVFAEMVLDDLETQCLNKLDFTPIFFFRFVDDILSCFQKNKVDKMIQVFNNHDNNFKLTGKK